MSTLHFGSLSDFVAGTKDMTTAQAKSLADRELATLFDWIEATPAAQRVRNIPPEIDRLLDYTGDLKALLSYLDYGDCSKSGYKLAMILSARTQWGQNEKPNSEACVRSDVSGTPETPQP